MQIQLTCVELPKHGRVTLIQEAEVDEEVQHAVYQKHGLCNSV